MNDNNSQIKVISDDNKPKNVKNKKTLKIIVILIDIIAIPLLILQTVMGDGDFLDWGIIVLLNTIAISSKVFSKGE